MCLFRAAYAAMELYKVNSCIAFIEKGCVESVLIVQSKSGLSFALGNRFYYFVKTLILQRSVLNKTVFLYSHIRLGHIIYHICICKLRSFPFRTLVLQTPLLTVEPSPFRSLAADCPILAIFEHSHISLFHLYVVVC